jgi:hypothetical protein
MVVRLLEDGPTRLCLHARPAYWTLPATLLAVAILTVWLARESDVAPWVWIAGGFIGLTATVLFLAARVRFTLDATTAQVEIERGRFHPRKASYPFAQVERIAIRQRVEPYSYTDEYELDAQGWPDELRQDQTTLVLALILKTGQELTIVERMRGGREGMALVRKLEKFRKGALETGSIRCK